MSTIAQVLELPSGEQVRDSLTMCKPCFSKSFTETEAEYNVYRHAVFVLRKEKLRECPKLPLIMPDPENVKLRQIAGRAFLDFPVNEMVIYPDYRNNPNELARIQKR